MSRFLPEMQNQDPELQPELDLLNPDNPFSLINILPKSMSEPLKTIPEELLMMGDKALEKKGNIRETEKRLRHSFWLEYNHAVHAKRMVNMPNIYNGVCRKEQWWHQIITDAYKLAYILTPPPDYKIAQSELLALAFEEMRKILERDIVTIDQKGREVVDGKLAGAKVKIADILMNRVFGQATQRIETQSKNLNVTVDANAPPATIEDLNKQIADIEARMKIAAPKVKDVRPKEVKKATMPEVLIDYVESPGMEDVGRED